MQLYCVSDHHFYSLCPISRANECGGGGREKKVIGQMSPDQSGIKSEKEKGWMCAGNTCTAQVVHHRWPFKSCAWAWSYCLNLTFPSFFTRLCRDTSLISYETVFGPWQRNFSLINIQPKLFEHNGKSSDGNNERPRNIYVHPRQGKVWFSSTCLFDHYRRLRRASERQTVISDGLHAWKAAGTNLLW